MKKWLHEPLVHFLLIGAALFGLFAVWGGPAIPPAGQYHIVITPTMVQNLVLSYRTATQRDPTPQELDAYINDYVREEILNREARALNLDQDDPIIRRELRGKMEFTLEDSAKAATPTDAQLNDFLQKHAATYRRPDGSLPSLAEVRDQVTAAWQYEQRRITANTAYDKLRARYVVDIQKPTATAANATVNTSATAAAATSTSSSK
jgi:hypothetical protein